MTLINNKKTLWEHNNKTYVQKLIYDLYFPKIILEKSNKHDNFTNDINKSEVYKINCGVCSKLCSVSQK